jgi:hypothetical protein
MRYLTRIAAALIFIPLFLALLFMMPVEFVAASWHLWRADSTTEGRVTASEVRTHRGNARSVIRYLYTVGDKNFEGSRVRAGWISDQGFEAGAGDLAQAAAPGSSVTVHYDSRHPDFSLLAYGWPKWSIGFSLAVWGMILGAWVDDPQTRGPSSHLLYGLTRGTLLLGFLIVFLLPPTIDPGMLAELPVVWLILAAVAMAYSRLRFGKLA